jgi:hypothetical protein
MTDIFETVKTVLEDGCGGVPVYYEKLPVDGAPQAYIRFQRISSHEYFSHAGRSNLHRDRFQVTCVGRTHALLIALVGLMETALYCNNTDFKLAYPLEGSREIPDGANTYQKDFYIFYTP